LAWWDLTGGRHCMTCDPPVQAERLRATAARLRRQAQLARRDQT
jgi:hypothetical protein